MTNHVDDRGSVTVEAIFAISAVMLVILFGVAAGRVTVTTAAVEAAARAAAREASIARTAPEARTNALRSARESLGNSDVSCASLQVQVETRGFAVPVGTPATVSATVRCAVPLGDLALPGLPGQVNREARFVSPLDVHRGRET